MSDFLSQKNSNTILQTSKNVRFNCCIISELNVVLFAERVMKIMDYDEGSFQDYTGHHDSVTNVLFSPCGKFLVSTCSSTVHVWDVVVQ